jgi:hypothetical protein
MEAAESRPFDRVTPHRADEVGVWAGGEGQHDQRDGGSKHVETHDQPRQQVGQRRTSADRENAPLLQGVPVLFSTTCGISPPVSEIPHLNRGFANWTG